MSLSSYDAIVIFVTIVSNTHRRNYNITMKIFRRNEAREKSTIKLITMIVVIYEKKKILL